LIALISAGLSHFPEAYAMSARGWLVKSPGSRRSKLVSESKRYIPLFWLSFLSSEDIANAEYVGQYKIDRKRAVERGLDALPFLSALFPQVPGFGEFASHLVAKLRDSRCPTIGIEVVELLCEDDHGGAVPTIGAAVEAIESRDPGYSLALPSRTVPNPFLPDEAVKVGGRTLSIRDLLMEVCWIQHEDLASKDEEWVQCLVIGYVYPGRGL
jgi:hypothetical protein